MGLAEIRKAIDKDGRVPLKRASFTKHSVEIFGAAKTLGPKATIAALAKGRGTAVPRSTVEVIGEGMPKGFGKGIFWDPADEQLAVIVFLNVADPLGVMISGVRQFDTIEFTSATGIAHFREGTQNKGISALIGVVAAGANLTAAVFGAPEVAPLINAAAKFAQDQFQEKKVKELPRDPFGVNPTSGALARQAGGVIVSLPEAGQNFYSGDEDHQERWIKEPGTRDFEHHPKHIRGAFFLRGINRDRHQAGADGDAIISAWDVKFDNNSGFYRLHVLLKRGKPPIVT
jgi:hypothetical protein